MRKPLVFTVLVLMPVLLGAVILLEAGALRAGATRLPAIPMPQWGPDIQVNQFQSNRPTFAFERNPMLAVRPTDPNVVIAGYDSYEDSTLAAGYANSTDAGRSWSSGRFTGPWGNDELTPIGNVSVAYDGFGTGYYISQAVSNTLSGYFVLTTTDGTAWGKPIPIALYSSEQYRAWATLVADPRTSGPDAGRLYVFWYGTQSQSPYYLGILMTYSQDGGRTWSPEISVSDPANDFAYRPYPYVAADGTVYVAFEELDNFYIGNPPKLYLDRSTDGGLTWGTDQLISGAPIMAIGRPDWKGRELTLVADANCQLLRINHFPAIAASPTDSRIVYSVWNDGRWEPTRNLCDDTGHPSDIAFSRSTDGGMTWGAPVRLNDDALGNGVDQIEPNIAVHADGTIGVVWYDRRDDPDHYLYDLYYSQSTDEGATWSANARVSDVSSNPDAVVDVKGIADLGYRPALTYGPDYALPGWLDTRIGGHEGDLFVDRGVLTATTPVATATSSPTASPTASPLASATASPTAVASPTATTSPIATATPCAFQFSDVHPVDYFYTPVLYLACHGVVGGYADGTFRPYNQTTRGQVSKMLVNGFGWAIQTPATPTFVDVPVDQPFYAFIETAAAHGIISGYSCGGPGEPCPGRYFRPGADVTRGQLAKMVVGAKGWPLYTPPTPTFADVPASNPFFGYVERAYAQSVLSGYGCGGVGEPCPGLYFRPGNDSTRGQLSKILYNVLTAP